MDVRVCSLISEKQARQTSKADPLKGQRDSAEQNVKAALLQQAGLARTRPYTKQSGRLIGQNKLF